MKYFKSLAIFFVIFVFVFAFALLLTAHAQDSVTEAKPWWERVEQFQALAKSWLEAITFVAGLLFTLIGFVMVQINNLKQQKEQLNKRLDLQSQKINDVALATMPVNSAPVITPNPAPNSPLNLSLVLALLLPVFLFGCASVADFLESPANAKAIEIASNFASNSLLKSTGIKATPDQEAIIQSAASSAIQTASTGAVWYFAEWLRTKQSTPSAAKAGSIAAGGVPLPIASAVPALVATGVSPDTANETVAMAVQSIAASKKQ